MARAQPLRAAPSALVSRPVFGPTATASDSQADAAGTAPRSPDSANSLPRHWPHATADKSSRAASAGTRQRRRSLVEIQFLDLARIRRYTANSGECLCFSSGHVARPLAFAATFLHPNLDLSRAERSAAHSWAVSPQPTTRQLRPDLGRDCRRNPRDGQPVIEDSIPPSREPSKRSALGHFCQANVGHFWKAPKGSVRSLNSPRSPCLDRSK
jgi:hypothetical protein